MNKITLKEKVEILKKVDLFKEFTDYVLSGIADVMEEINLKAGERIITQGEEGNCMFILVEGKAKVHENDIKIAEVEALSILGEMALLTSEPRIANVTLVEDSHLLTLNREAFEVISEDNLDFYKSIVKLLISKLQKQNTELIGIAKNARKVLSSF
jgi:CRP/FNR family transcriptional regulator, cyclic AMP receptor protein